MAVQLVTIEIVETQKDNGIRAASVPHATVGTQRSQTAVPEKIKGKSPAIPATTVASTVTKKQDTTRANTR